jgi:hypothetical protein
MKSIVEKAVNTLPGGFRHHLSVSACRRMEDEGSFFIAKDYRTACDSV